ncbi:ABC transporter permease [Roseiarcaceae bacterium H3SJ34-1]|uniref:ABC transporter permease n=1 Tax=Terripilifer ovatus TaxID=3032367 RepID=UPI003AB96C2A|nr:ABC transporter permease [Roseiarcaceae bacterium H3SJ34-1]
MALQLVNGIAYGNLLFLIAAGFTLIFGILRVINMAHGSLYLLGAHTAISTATVTHSVWAGIIAGALAAAALGALIERTLLYRIQGNYLAQVIVTIGVLMIVGDLCQVYWGGTPRIYTLPESLRASVPLGELRYPLDRLLLVAIGPAIALALWFLIERTAIGAKVRAAVDDEEIAQAIGISVPRLRVLVFALGGLLAGLAGALGSTFIGAKAGIDLDIILLALVIVVIGGPGSLVGSYVAALAVGLIDSIGKSVWPEASMFLLFAPMLAVLIVRPHGLFGKPPGPATAARQFKPIRIPVPDWIWSFIDVLRHGAAHVSWPVAAVVALLAGVAVPVFGSGFLVTVVVLMLIWSMFAIGLNIMLGYGGMPSLGHALFFGAGAYAMAWSGFAGLSAYIGLVAAVACACGAALFLTAVALRAREAQLLLVTLAVAQVVWGLVFKWRSVTGGDDGLIHPQAFPLLWNGLSPSTSLYIHVAVAFALALLAYAWFAGSNFRLLLTGVRGNEPRLLALGYNVDLLRLKAILLSSAFSGFAGGLAAVYSGFAAPELFGVHTSARVLMMVVIGMAGTFFGPIIGAVSVIGMEEVVSSWTERSNSLLGALYIIVALFAFGGVRFVRRRIAARCPASLAPVVSS